MRSFSLVEVTTSAALASMAGECATLLVMLTRFETDSASKLPRGAHPDQITRLSRKGPG